MTAKEMFQDLGYKIDKDYSERFNCISYKKELERGYEVIDFDLKKLKCRPSFLTFKYVRDPKSLNLQELQAINKQISELDWNKVGE